METLRAAIQPGAGQRLDLAALEMAAIETPGLDPAPFVEILDRIASRIAEIAPGSAGGREFVRAANDHLFGELGFRGNETDYYDPRNSCINFVLDRRVGIPITLSVIYIEVARRLGRPVAGVGLPGHFIVEYNDGQFATYIDPFHGGKLLGREECLEIARERTGSEPVDAALAPVDTRYILVRMLNNLRAAYFRKKQFQQVIAVTDVLLEAFPRNGEYYRSRGLARLRMRQFRNAKQDLELYLKLSPEAEDRKQIAEQLRTVHRWLGRLN